MLANAAAPAILALALPSAVLTMLLLPHFGRHLLERNFHPSKNRFLFTHPPPPTRRLYTSHSEAAAACQSLVAARHEGAARFSRHTIRDDKAEGENLPKKTFKKTDTPSHTCHYR